MKFCQIVCNAAKLRYEDVTPGSSRYVFGETDCDIQ